MINSMSALNKNRVLVIALGEATLDLIDPWIKDGELPTFKKFYASGKSVIVIFLAPFLFISSMALAYSPFFSWV